MDARAPEPAPLFDDIAFGPEGGRAFWLRASDGVRLRIAHWPALAALEARGTVLLFPGRTEYCEKYGPTAGELAAMGYGTLTVDWRGQGLADRLCPNPMLGHVDDYGAYQLDVAAMVAAARALALPEPFFLLAHSMGGAIGLRALHEGLPVNAAAFSAPMWGISLSARLRVLAWGASWLATRLGRACTLAPGTVIETYVLANDFAGNQLTKDENRYRFMQRQARAHPELTLGGPSMGWLYASLRETRALRAMAPPRVASVTFLGSDERIIDTAPVHDLMARWGDLGRLEMIEGAEHEVLMEPPEIRVRINGALAELFRTHGGET